MSTRLILVTGATGQVGTALARMDWPAPWRAVALGRDALDLSDPIAIAACVAEGHQGAPWAAVINAAAYTAVDQAETDQLAAWQINALAPAALAAACRNADIPLVHVSTDYVFPGDKQGAWTIADHPAPLGVYGASKLGGELAIRTSGARHAIIRTAWVVSAHGHNFVKTMLRIGAERECVSVVADQRGAPTSATDLAQALATIAMRMATDADAPGGIFHFSNAGDTDWATFADEIFRQSTARGGPGAIVTRIGTADYPTPARRPANSLLDCSAIEAGYGLTPRPWRNALGDILDELIGART